MENLIGQTVSYAHKGELTTIKVLDIVHRQGQAIYKLFYPATKKFGEALVTLFNQRFKTHRGAFLKKNAKGSKGKVIKKKQTVID